MAIRDQLKQVKLLVVGDVMLDRYWFGDVERISPEAPVPIVLMQKKEERLGGAANVARNSAVLGVKTGILGLVGSDEAGVCVEHLLTQVGIKSHIKVEPSVTTTIKQRVLARQQQLLRMDFDRYPDEKSVAAMLPLFKKLLPDYDTIILSDYDKGVLCHVAEKIAAARALGKRVLVDPKGDDYSCYRGASFMTPNRAELRRVVGAWRSEEDLTTRAQNLRRELCLEGLLLTRSEEGMTLYTADQVHHVPAQAREVFDVSGAGDTVIAVLAATLSVGMPLITAVNYANRAGAIVVGKLGTATVSLSELFG